MNQADGFMEPTLPDIQTYDNPQAGVVQNYAGYKDYRTVNPYEFLEHTYYGSEHYRDCGYLQHTDRETFYQTRRKISCYINVFKPIINAMVDPVFSSEIKRESPDILFQKFLENCDNAGTTFNTFIKNAIKHARLFTLNFIVVDNHQNASDAQTVDQQVDARLYPYVYEKKPQQVQDYKCDANGKLLEITFTDKCEEVVGKDFKRMRQYYRSWTNENWLLYYTEMVEGKEVKVISGSGEHGLGVIPVVVITSFADSANISEFPQPEFYNMAAMCHALFNKESQVSFMEIMQTFAILCTSGMGNSAKALGPATFLDSPTEAAFAPQYVAPPQEGIKTLVDNCQRLKAEIKDEAKQSGVIAVTEASSGIAKEWDFRAEEYVLKDTAKAAVDTEIKVAEIFGLYTGWSVNYVVEYPKRFDPHAEQNDINGDVLLLKEMPPEPIKNNIWLDIARRRWKNDPERLATIELGMSEENKETETVTSIMEEDDSQ